MSKAMSLLAIANALLMGKAVPTIAKAEGEDPDNLDTDPRAGEGSPSEEDLEKARQEAQAGQAANPDPNADPNGGTPGEGGEGDGGQPGGAPAGAEGNEGGGGEGEEGEVTKAEVLDSIRFLARSHGITGGEIAKAFTDLEGDPAVSQAPLGQGEKLLESIVTGMNSQGKILEAIASSLAEFARQTVSLKEEVAKAHQEGNEAARLAAETAAAVAALPKTAAALAAKGATAEQIAKAHQEGAAPRLSGDQLFQLALSGKLSPQEVAQANRTVNYTAPPSA